MEMLHWLLLISVVCIAGNLSKKDCEKFQKVMADALAYTMGAGIVFCFLEFLGFMDIEIPGLSFVINRDFSPLQVMNAISVLFLCSFVINSRKLHG